MSRHQRVRQITYGLTIIIIGILLMVMPKIPFLHLGGTILLGVLALFQLLDKSSRQAIILALLAIAFYFIFPYAQGFLYIIGLVLVFVGIFLAATAWLKSR